MTDEVPEDLQKYKDIIEDMSQKIQPLIAAVEDGYQGQDVMVFVVGLSSVISKIKKIVEGLKEVADNDRVAVYLYLKAAILEKALTESSLSDDDKEQVKSYFGESGLVTTLISAINEKWQEELEKMDTNNDDMVSKAEFEAYWQKKCGCCGNTGCQESCVKSCMSCCWPTFSGGKDHIDIEKS